MPPAAPRFSVVIPTLGRPSLALAVRSVLAQTEPDFELIVVSDGDPTPAAEVLVGISDTRLRLVDQPDLGVSAARNLGIALARGGWVTFLDDDDQARPSWLQTWRAAIRPVTQVVTGEMDAHGTDTMTCSRRCHLDPGDPKASASVLQAGGFIVRADLLRAVGGYDPELRYFENYDLGLRLCDRLAPEGSQLVAHTPTVVADIASAPPGARMTRYGSARGEAAELVLAKHPARFALDRPATAAFLRIVSRSARLAGDTGKARRAAFRALRHDPAQAKNWRSAGAALLALRGSDE